MTYPDTFDDFVTVEKLKTNQYISKWPAIWPSFNPDTKVAYGGFTLAVAIKAGYATVKDQYRLYSCLGHFLGPAAVGEKLVLKVTVTRDSRSFATRRVDVFQGKGSKSFIVASMLLDFHAIEKASLLTYSAKPKLEYSPPEKSWDESKVLLEAQKKGIPGDFLHSRDGAGSARQKYFEMLAAPESFAADTFHGMLPKLGSVQQHLSISEKAHCYYWRTQKPITSPANHAAALAFLLDAGMPVTPVAFAAIEPSKIAAITSLDFALRFFSNEIDVHQFLKREEETIVGGDGRTYTEARVWDPQGNMVASMSEQCLLRARAERKGKL